VERGHVVYFKSVSTLDHYKGSVCYVVGGIQEHLFCLNMLWGLDITSLQLGDRAAKAAFALAEAVVAPLQDAHMSSEEDQTKEEEPALAIGLGSKPAAPAQGFLTYPDQG
jgi:hypothetical protein